MPDTPMELGPFQVSSDFISHPGPTLGYRVQSGGKTLTYLPDHEPVIGRLSLYPEDEWVSGFDLAENTDLLIHDAQYTQAEYQTKFGWGHSSLEMAVEFSTRTRSKKLLLFHHDPNHTDVMIDEMFENLVADGGFDFTVKMAVEGSEIEV
jgi:ribonuclease BN (tRNA processing enzyme)